MRSIGQAPDVAGTNLGFGILDVFVKVRPEKPKPGSCMNFWVERKCRDHRFRVSRVQIPGLLVDFRLVDGHAHVQAKMLGPRGHIVFQTEQAELIQIFFERAMERAVAPKCSLHFLHQNSKLLSISLAMR